MEQKENTEKKVIQIIKTSENIVRDSAEMRKNVMICNNVINKKRLYLWKYREIKNIKEILKKLNEEETKFEEVLIEKSINEEEKRILKIERSGKSKKYVIDRGKNVLWGRELWITR